MARSASWKREREGEGPSTSCVTFESAALHDEKKIDSIPAIAFVLWRALRPNSCTRKLSRAIFLSRGQGLGKKKRKKRPLSSVDFSLCILLGTEACARRAHSSLHLDDKKKILNSLSLSLSLRSPSQKQISTAPRRSRRAAAGGGALRLARFGGIFALGLAAATRARASVYTPIRGPATQATEANGKAAAAKGPPGIAGLFADPELAHRDADYAHFAELLGTVMLLREGGVEGAMDAVPILHDESLAYLTAASLIAESDAALSLAATNAGAAGAFNLSSWPGLSTVSALKMAKNYTALLENDPLTASGDAVGAQIDAAFGPETPKNDAKTNATMDALNSLGSFVTAGKADDDAFIADLNSRLSKYNIEFTGMFSFSSPLGLPKKEKWAAKARFFAFRKCLKSRTSFFFFRSPPCFPSFFFPSSSLLPLPLQARTSAPRRGLPTAPPSSPGPSRAWDCPRRQ